MWPTRLFVLRPALVFVSLALIAVAGAISLMTIVQQQFPNIDFPTITVRASYPGGSTTDIRDAVVRPIEDAIAGAPDLDHINTTVQQGQATISAVFSLNSNKTTDLVQVQRRLLVAQSQLPSDMPAPTVGTFDPAEATILTIGLSSPSLTAGELSAIVTNNIVPDLEQVDGVSNVNVGGLVTPAIEVTVNPNSLVASGLTLNDIVSTIAQNNEREPGGIAYLPNHETTIDVRGDVSNASTVADLPVFASSPFTSTFGNASYNEPALPGSPGAPASSSSSASSAGAATIALPSPAAQSSAAAASSAATAPAVVVTPASSASSSPMPSPSASASASPAPVAMPNLAASVIAHSSATAAPTAAPPQAQTTSAASTGSGGYAGPALSSLNPWSASARLIRIGDIAAVTDSFELQRQYSYVGTVPTISLSIQKATGASEVTAAQNVMQALPAIERTYPEMDFRILNDQASYTKQQIWGVFHTLIEAIAITAVVMLFFLRSWRNAVVVLISIPASLCVTLAAMKIVNFTIDTVSLLAMTLIIGILVDDSIVVLENVERHYENGEAPKEAAIKGRTQIGPAAVVITLVDVVVFLPIAFLPGQTGRFLAEFGLVVTIATLTSLIVSFTVTPSLAGNWSLLSTWRPPGIINAFTRGFERLRTFYAERVLNAALRWRWFVFGGALVLTCAAISLIPLGFIGFAFLPAVDRGQIFCTVQFPTGTPLTTTDAAVRLLSARFMQLPDIDTITSTSGSSQAGFGGSVNLGSNGQIRVLLTLTHRTHTTDQIAAMMNRIGHQLVPDARIFAVPATGTRGGNQQPIDATVSATRGEPDAYAPAVLQALEDTPGTSNVNSSALQ